MGKASADAQVKAAMAACIATEIRAGREPDQARAICYEMLRKRIRRMTGGEPK